VRFILKIQILILLNFVFQNDILGQFANKMWYFGEQAGITFNTIPPSTLTNGQLQAYDNTSTITDTSGNLLFYTNGITVWDKNHNPMPNGTGLGGNLSAGQSTLIVPQPNSSKFYIFTVGYASADAFRYSIVDLALNSGNGAVTTKANIIFNGSTEKIDAIYNPSDTSYWVMTHTWNTNQYYCYKINYQGLQISTPVINSIGSINSGGNPTGYNALGQMTFSEDGSKLVTAIYYDGKIEIFDFNVATATLSNPIILTGFYQPWGIAISDNNRFVYYTEWFDSKVIQLDIISGTPSTIIGSKTTVGTGTFPNTTSGYKIGYLERGPDAKIYIAKFGQNYISCINYPNLSGSACQFVDNAIFLGTKTCNAGLSRLANTPHNVYCYRDYHDSIYICFGDSVLLNGKNYHAPFSFSDTLLASDGCDSIMHYYLFNSILPSIDLGNDTSICNGDSIKISAGIGFNSYLWNTGSINQSIIINSGGQYWVSVKDSLCSNSDTINVTNNSNSSQSINDTTICNGDTYTIKLNPSYSYQWWDGSLFYENNLTQSGFYWVQIIDNCKTYTINFNLSIKDCNCNIFIPNVFTPNNDGINDFFFPVISCETYDYHFIIFNRWGQIIYESSTQALKWDGTFENKEVPEGVYFYILSYKIRPEDKKLTSKVGSVTRLK